MLVLGAGALALWDAADAGSPPAAGGRSEPQTVRDAAGTSGPAPPPVPHDGRAPPDPGSPAHAAASGAARDSAPFLDADAVPLEYADGPVSDVGAFLDPDGEPPWVPDAETVDVGAFLDADAN